MLCPVPCARRPVCSGLAALPNHDHSFHGLCVAKVAEVAAYFGEASGSVKEPEEPFRIMDQFVESFLKVDLPCVRAKPLLLPCLDTY